ncbi:DUF6542 domain-containing protein [Kitasatospora aureofaciens]|uniref:DUF6542 domain-containing protein n=1 Tax=Kitasatospora aureofaciens TaxID=1894 RepID=UPI001C44FA3D|nr:DUF6542 domain-containing protein [Kitasatospora aureofaciens]MBV6698626.1 hypothetical protein [Kitasatospora aureofaciens]
MAGRRGRTSSNQETEQQAARRTPAPARSLPGGPVLPAVLAIGLPAVGAGIDELSGPGMGFAFAAGAVLGTGLAAMLSTRRGWWWVLCASPLLVLGVTAGAELLANGDMYKGKALATGSAKWVVHGFPVMAAAAGAAVLVIVVRVILDGRKHHG